MTAALPLTAFTGWLAMGERGISSEAIVSALTGVPVGRRLAGDDYPHDPSDFRRCEDLLDAVPLARLVFANVMQHRSPEWRALVAEWDGLCELMEVERPTGSCPRMYARMRELTRGAQL